MGQHKPVDKTDPTDISSVLRKISLIRKAKHQIEHALFWSQDMERVKVSLSQMKMDLRMFATHLKKFEKNVKHAKSPTFKSIGQLRADDLNKRMNALFEEISVFEEDKEIYRQFDEEVKKDPFLRKVLKVAKLKKHNRDFIVNVTLVKMAYELGGQSVLIKAIEVCRADSRIKSVFPREVYVLSQEAIRRRIERTRAVLGQ